MHGNKAAGFEFQFNIGIEFDLHKKIVKYIHKRHFKPCIE